MKTLKDLLMKEPHVTGQETKILIESVKVPHIRDDLGDLGDLGRSIEADGLRHPITVWTDGTIISGVRRLRAHFLIAGQPGKSEYRNIPAVFVDNIEDAAKRLLDDNGDEQAAIPLKSSEMCRLWSVLRDLDRPAAVKRMDAARRQGVEMRRLTVSGKRPPGRSKDIGRGDDYVFAVLSEPFGISGATAQRLFVVHSIATDMNLSDERRQQAAAYLADIDAGSSSIWRSYSSLVGGRRSQTTRVPGGSSAEVVPAARQRAAWDRSLPQMEGLVAGLSELGAPHPDLTWDQVGPVQARLRKIRRDLEKIINNMKEPAKS